MIIDVFTSSSDEQNYTVEVIPVEQSELKWVNTTIPAWVFISLSTTDWMKKCN